MFVDEQILVHSYCIQVYFPKSILSTRKKLLLVFGVTAHVNTLKKTGDSSSEAVIGHMSVLYNHISII